MAKARNASQKLRQRRQRAVRRGVTYDVGDFKWICDRSNRVNIVAEGDSWFAYPRRNLIFGKNSNVLDWVAARVSGSGKANLLRLAANGDEAVEMLAGSQKHRLAEIMRRLGERLHLVLFSAGGNDVVGKWDLERLLNDYQPGFGVLDCLNTARLERKLTQIELAYRELVELCEEYAPNAKIVSHTYDIVKPRPKSAKFVAGLIATGPWIYPYLVKKGIPEALHLPVISVLLNALEERLLGMAADPVAGQRLHVVATQGTLRPGHGSDWKDEIHPTPSGFKRITRIYYAKMRELEPGLPAF
jgi:hypothetical protein